MSFAVDLGNFAKKAQVNIDQVKRKLVLDITTSVVIATPVDTGRARANWVGSVGNPSGQTNQSTDKAGGSTIQRVFDVAGTKWDVFFITNSLPYIERLEYGYSKQAPSGMVRITVARFKEFTSAIGVR